MKTRTPLFYMLLLLSWSVTSLSAQQTILTFSFDEMSGTTTEESLTNTELTISSGPGSVERIPGVSGNALRTYGYYSWASGMVNTSFPADELTITGWMAPAAFPVHRKDDDPITENTLAALFSNIDPDNNGGAALGINHHGKVFAQFYVDGNLVQLQSSAEVRLHEWNFIGLSVNAANGRAEIYLNGEMARNTTFSGGSLNWSGQATTYLGRGYKDKQLAGFVTNGLNGGIDEVNILDQSMTMADHRNLFNQYSPEAPDLKVPVADKFENDHHRPRYHAMPDFGWTNEPHGLLYIDGQYHLFNQANLNGSYWSHIHWGHYVSDDLVNWEEKPPVLWPQPGFDEVGVWSGHAIVDDGQPYIFYTGVNKAIAGIGVAISAPPYDQWVKINGNPVIATAPTNYQHADFRDPYLFQHNDTWYMMVGTGLRDDTPRGGLFLYRSTSEDFRSWELLGTMYEGIPGTDGTGDFWEMPVYCDFGEESVLLVNKLPDAKAMYWTGNFDGNKFIPKEELPQELDPITGLLSPAIYPDEEGKLTAIGIIPDLVSSAKHKAQGWANIFSLPRIWELMDGKIVQKPHPNLDSLRESTTEHLDLQVNDGESIFLNGASGTQTEIEATVDPGDADKVGFVLNAGLNGLEQTLIYYRFSTQQFVVDGSSSSVLSNVPKSIQTGEIPLERETMNWRIFIDGSVIEVFVNEEIAFSTRSFPSKGSNAIGVFAEGGAATFEQVNLHELKSTLSTSVFGLPKEKKIEATIYPNPSPGTFFIELENIQRAERSQIFILDTSGRLIRQLNVDLYPGRAQLQWDGLLSNGQKAPAGLYFVQGRLNGKYLFEKLIVR